MLCSRRGGAKLTKGLNQKDAVTVCLVWVSPEAKPTSRTRVQFIYLEGDPRKKEGGSQKNETGRKEKAT